MEMLFSIFSNLQTHYHLKLDFQNVDQHIGASDKSTAPNTTRTISCQVWNSPVVYPGGEYKHGTNESEGNMFNPIFKDKVRGQKHPGRGSGILVTRQFCSMTDRNEFFRCYEFS